MNPFPENFPDVSDVSSPALLFYPDRIQRNINRMIEIAGDASRLRPHIKTHKSREIVRMQVASGIHKFKCATLAEVELLGQEMVDDVLLAIQPVGPDIARFVALAKFYGDTTFSVVVDSTSVVHQLNVCCEAEGIRLGVFLDLNVGMDRTGIKPGMEALARYRLLHEMPYLDVSGLHIYDGHIHDSNLEHRTDRVEDCWTVAGNFIGLLERMGFAPPVLIVGGSPSFPIHAKRRGVELSPGTTLLWDLNGVDGLKDLPFDCAAFLLTRVVSKPAPGLVCFDLGHKAVAAEMPQPRVRLQGLEDAEFVSQSEEHLVLETDGWESIRVGDTYLGIPRHVCPTVALYDHVHVVEDDQVSGTWEVAARHRL